MIELKGKYTNAKLYVNEGEAKMFDQVQKLINQPFTKGVKVRIMPDCHAGKGCVIGTTMTVTNQVVPSLVGVDIGCGVICIKLDQKNVDLVALDKFIRHNIPYGSAVHTEVHKNIDRIKLHDLKCQGVVNMDRTLRSLASLGGGNHFIEVNTNSKGELFLVIHSGSRSLGLNIANYYQMLAIELYEKERETSIVRMIEELKAKNQHHLIAETLKEYKAIKVDKNLIPLNGESLNDYLHDMAIAQQFATVNRQSMAEDILSHFGWEAIEQFDTIHNYIDLEHQILRKGAVSAKLGEKLIIPINMRDGSIIALGKGNDDWNCSAPHGAGRVLSRSAAKQVLNLADFEETMKDVYTTSVGKSTIDEAPMAYKTLDHILGNTAETIEVVEVIKPIYNFKASN